LLNINSHNNCSLTSLIIWSIFRSMSLKAMHFFSYPYVIYPLTWYLFYKSKCHWMTEKDMFAIKINYCFYSDLCFNFNGFFFSMILQSINLFLAFQSIIQQLMQKKKFEIQWKLKSTKKGKKKFIHFEREKKCFFRSINNFYFYCFSYGIKKFKLNVKFISYSLLKKK